MTIDLLEATGPTADTDTVRTRQRLVDAAGGVAAIFEHTDDESLRAGLAYVAVYCCGYVGEGPVQPFTKFAWARDERFVESLVQSIGDRRRHALAIPSGAGRVGSVVLELDGVSVEVDAARLVDAGDHVVLDRSALSLHAAPGFVVRTGIVTPRPGAALSRIYLDLTVAGATWLLGDVARRLDADGVAFELKVLGNPRNFRRHDAGVIYVDSATESTALAIVDDALETATETAPVLGAGAPLLTRLVRPGVAVADEPSDLFDGSKSHGQWVADLLVEAAAHRGDPAQFADAVLAGVAAAGRDPRRSHRRR